MKVAKNLDNDKMKSICNNFLKIIRYLDKKDFFKKAHQRYLQRRLLTKDANVKYEKKLVKVIKKYTGWYYTRTFEFMFKDLKTSAVYNKKFKESLESEPEFEADFKVLKSSNWPLKPSSQTNLPSPMSKSFEAFNKFYTKCPNQVRVLKLHNDYGIDEILLTIPGDNDKTLIVNDLQAAVLMLFNKKTEYSVDDLLKETKIENDWLNQVLRSLAFGRKGTKVLMKSSPGTEIVHSDVFQIKVDLLKELDEVVTPMMTAPKDKAKQIKNAAEGNETIDAIQQAIFRIMKTKKSIMLDKLVSEILQQLKNDFEVEEGQVVEEIEKYVKKNFIKRHDTHIYTRLYLE